MGFACAAMLMNQRTFSAMAACTNLQLPTMARQGAEF